MGSPSMMRLRRLCTMSRSARAASTACCTPVFRPCSTPKSANATLTWRKMRMVRPGLRQMPDQMRGRNFILRRRLERSPCSRMPRYTNKGRHRRHLLQLSIPARLTLRLPASRTQQKDVGMKRISLALLAAVLPALSAAPHAATLGVSMALFDDNFLTAVRASMKERAQQLNVPIQFEDAQNDIGRQLPPRVSFVGSGEAQSGTLQMAEVCRLLQGKGEIVILIGELTNQAARQATQDLSAVRTAW